MKHQSNLAQLLAISVLTSESFFFLKVEMERKATVTGNMFLEAVNASAHNTRSNTRKWTENIVTEEVVSNKLSKS